MSFSRQVDPGERTDEEQDDEMVSRTCKGRSSSNWPGLWRGNIDAWWHAIGNQRSCVPLA